MRRPTHWALLLGLSAVVAGAILWQVRGTDREPVSPTISYGEIRSVPPILVGTERAEPRVVAEPSARITGRVWNGRTAERANVRAWRREDVPSRLEATWWWPVLEEDATRPADIAAETDAEGRFRLDDVAPGSWWLVAESPAGRATRRLRVAATGGEAPVDLRLLTGLHAVRGRVRRQDGTPWLGRVLAVPDDGKKPEERSLLGDAGVTTDAEGRFDLRGVPTGRSLLGLLDPEGRLQIGWPIDAPTGDAIEVVVDEDVSWVAGRVFAKREGLPLEGAVVRARSLDPAEEVQVLAAVRTDAEGRFRVPSRTGGVFVLVRAPGYAEARFQVTGSIASLDIGLERAGRILGRVTRSDGAPVGGIRVEASVNSYGQAEEVPAAWTRSAADGSYAIEDAPLGRVFVSARGGGLVTKDLRGEALDQFAVEVAEDGAVVRNLMVVPGARMEGRALDPEGQPAPGVPIRFRLVRMYWGDPLQHRGDLSSDERGGFSLDGMVPGERYAFWVEPDPGHRWMKGMIHASSVQPARLDLHLERFHDVEVTVLDEDGHAVEGADVARVWADMPHWRARTAPDGTASLEGVEEDGITFRVRRTGYAPKDTVVRTEDQTRLTVRLSRAAPVAVVVVDSEGHPVHAWRVEVEVGEQRYSAGAGPDGRFRILAVPVGTWPLTVSEHWRWGVNLRQRVRAGDEDLRLVLPGAHGWKSAPDPGAGPRVVQVGGPAPTKASAPAASTDQAQAALAPPVVVTVLGPDGAPVEGIDVWTSSSPARRTDTLGRCEFTGLAPDVPLSLVVSPPWSPAGRSLLGTSFGDWRPADTTVRLERAYILRGVVQDLAGQVLPARIQTRHSPADPWWDASSATSGRFEIQDLPAGAVEVRAVVGRRSEEFVSSEGPAGERADVATPGSAPTRVRGDSGTELVLVVDTGLPLVVRVRPWSPPLHAVQVVLTSEQEGKDEPWVDQRSRATIDDQGVARFRYLPPDRTYLLRIHVPEQGLSAEVHGVRGSRETLEVDLVRDPSIGPR